MATTIQWLLQETSLGDFTLLAGEKGLQNRITGVNIMDNPDTIRWLQPGELILTTGYLFQQDTQLRARIIAALAERRCSGLGFVLKRYFDELPPAMRKDAEALGFPVLSVPYDLSLAKVGGMVHQHIFEEGMTETERLTAMYRRFAEGLAQESGVDGMIADIVAVAGCPVLVLDDSFSAVGHDTAGFHDMDSLFGTAEGAPVFSRPVMRHITDTVRGERPVRIQQRLAGENGNVRFIIFPVYDEANVLGYLCLGEAKRELGAFDYQFVQTIQPVLAVHLLRRIAHARLHADTQSDFMRFLMDSRSHSLSDIRMQCELRRLDGNRGRVCAVIRLSGYDSRDHRQRRGLMDTAFKTVGEIGEAAKGKGEDFRVMVHQNHLVLFFLHGDADDAAEDAGGLRESRPPEAVELMAGRLAGMGMQTVAGVSLSHSGLETLRPTVDQAFAAIRIGLALDRGRAVYRYRDYLLPHILSQSLPARQARDLHALSLGRLEAHDRKHAGELAETMRRFMQSRLNVRDAATLLGVHRNTMLHRLDRIRDILGRDPRGLDACLEVMAGMYARELLAAGLFEGDPEK